jgi:phosphatidylserine decarboxylase
MKIHKEGYAILFITALVLLGINYLIVEIVQAHFIVQRIVLVASLVLYIFVLQFFRNPEVDAPQNDNFILAPADGKVVVIEKTLESEYLNEERIQISIFMSPLNVHVNRNPVSGILKYFKYHPGKYLVAWHPKSSTENERTTLVYEMSNGISLPVRQIAGAVARRIKCYIQPGQLVNQGAEFGFIRFGSRVDVFVPLNAEIKISQGDKTRAGKTILAELKG